MDINSHYYNPSLGDVKWILKLTNFTLYGHGVTLDECKNFSADLPARLFRIMHWLIVAIYVFTVFTLLCIFVFTYVVYFCDQLLNIAGLGHTGRIFAPFRTFQPGDLS